jgi:fructokinase
MISRLGRDELGRKAHDQIVRLGLDTKFIQWDDEFPTGTVEVSFDEQNNPDYFITPQVAYDQIELTEPLVGVASTADCLCFGTLSQRFGKSGKTIEQLLNRASKSLKLLDINLRKDCYNLEIVTFSLQEADNLKLNEDEAGQLGLMLGIRHQSIPQFCEEMLERWSLQHCVVTLGEKGRSVKRALLRCPQRVKKYTCRATKSDSSILLVPVMPSQPVFCTLLCSRGL